MEARLSPEDIAIARHNRAEGEASLACEGIYLSDEERALDRQFGLLAQQQGLRGLSAATFASRAAEHLSELNAIHPFREGNGRTLRAFLKHLAGQAGHPLELTRINPEPWMQASIDSSVSGRTSGSKRSSGTPSSDQAARNSRSTIAARIPAPYGIAASLKS